jgi:hypothetical protein
MTNPTSLTAGTSLISVGPVCIFGLTGNTSNNAATVALHDSATTAGVGAGNLIHTYTLRTGSVGYSYDSMQFISGLCVVFTKNGATADLLLEWY